MSGEPAILSRCGLPGSLKGYALAIVLRGWPSRPVPPHASLAEEVRAAIAPERLLVFDVAEGSSPRPHFFTLGWGRPPFASSVSGVADAGIAGKHNHPV
jgi:hypothetical protein